MAKERPPEGHGARKRGLWLRAPRLAAQVGLQGLETAPRRAWGPVSARRGGSEGARRRLLGASPCLGETGGGRA